MAKKRMPEYGHVRHFWPIKSKIFNETKLIHQIAYILQIVALKYEINGQNQPYVRHFSQVALIHIFP